jgi:alkanesulfonate monooxygenase SsuD/methylene tetrahydromethanopterin reductase-like flavin-dependent oxidoreductase (luciferase family)
VPAEIAFGIVAAARAEHARLGTELQRLGYAELWCNDTRRGDGIATLAEIAAAAPGLRTGVGVVALSEHAPEHIAERVRASGIVGDRLTLGVGSGGSASLAVVRRGVASLRELLPGQSIAVAALGPRMARLAGEVADAVVANWALPDRLAWLRDRMAEGADAAGRARPRLVAYVRVAVGDGSEGRIRREMERYRRFGGDQYARAFDAQPDVLVGVAAPARRDVGVLLTPYRSVVDTLVVRGVPHGDDVDAWLDVAAAGIDEGGGG